MKEKIKRSESIGFFIMLFSFMAASAINDDANITTQVVILFACILFASIGYLVYKK